MRFEEGLLKLFFKKVFYAIFVIFQLSQTAQIYK